MSYAKSKRRKNKVVVVEWCYREPHNCMWALIRIENGRRVV